MCLSMDPVIIKRNTLSRELFESFEEINKRMCYYLSVVFAKFVVLENVS